MIDPSARIHPSVDIEPDVSIGPGTSVWHRAQIRTGARVGRDGVIGRDVFIDEGVTLGDRVKVQNGALDLPRRDDRGRRVHRTGRHPDQRPASRGRMTADGELARPPIGRSARSPSAMAASIGAGAVVVAGDDVGAYAMVGAGAVVTRDVAAARAGRRQPGPRHRLGLRLRRAPGRRRTASPADATLDRGRRRAACPACGRRYVRPSGRRRSRSELAARSAGSAGMIPIARPDIGPEEIAAVTEVLAERDARRRQARRRARGAVRRVHRRQARASRSATGPSP